MKQFRYLLKEIIESDHLPDYMLEFAEEKDQVMFINRESMPSRSESVSTASDASIIVRLSPESIDKARNVLNGWDAYYVQSRFGEWWNKIGRPATKNPDALFLKFCRTWTEKNGKP